MLKTLAGKIKEALLSVMPVTLIVVILYFTPLIHFTPSEIITFMISAILMVLGIGLFNLGADLAMMPMGAHVGSGLTATGKISVLLPVCFAMGVLITIAEPDLSVLAEQVKAIMNSTVLIVTVGIGVGVFLLLAILKIIFKKNLTAILLFFYMLLFSIAALLIERGLGSLMPLAFDSGGVTTGPITVPFIMALGAGIAGAIGGRDEGENSFGLISLCSVGPIIAVLILSLMSKGTLSFTIPDYSLNTEWSNILSVILSTMGEVSKALLLIVIFFAGLEIFVLKLPIRTLIKISIGILYTFVGLVIFLSAVSVGFVPIGYKLGLELAGNSKTVIIISGLVLGMVVVLAEPAVHVLNSQVEEITGGSVSKTSMLIALSIGVGTSICLSMVRIIYDFSILYYLIPGYLISLGLSFFVPGIYTAIAFDSGGVASGPLTSSFILPLVIGVCSEIQSESAVLSLAFGVVAMVAMAPLITIQALGFKAVLQRRIKHKHQLKRIYDADDAQIIYFNRREE